MGLRGLGLLVLTLGAACSRPVARRTWVFEVPGHGGYRHPARVAAADVSPALAVIPAYDRAGLAATIARTLGRIGPDEVVYYRHPHGGAWLFGVRGQELIVQGYGLRHGEHHHALPPEPGKPPPRLVGPVKVVDPGPTEDNGRDYPELMVISSIAVDQYLFVSGDFLGVVRAGQSATFKVPAGRVAVTATDDRAGEVNPMAQQFEFVAGLRHDLLIMPWLGR